MKISSKVDLYNLQYEVSEHELQILYKQAIENGYRAIGVLPTFIPMLKEITQNKLPVITIIGLPEGNGKYEYWSKQVDQAIQEGVDEIEWVLNHKQLADMETLIDNLRDFTYKCHINGIWTRLIIEVGNIPSIDKIATLVKETAFKGVMTSTGMTDKVATVENVSELKKKLPGIEIKASGKIYNKGWAEQLIKAGANLVATSRIL